MLLLPICAATLFVQGLIDTSDLHCCFISNLVVMLVIILNSSRRAAFISGSLCPSPDKIFQITLVRDAALLVFGQAASVDGGFIAYGRLTFILAFG